MSVTGFSTDLALRAAKDGIADTPESSSLRGVLFGGFIGCASIHLPPEVRAGFVAALNFAMEYGVNLYSVDLVDLEGVDILKVLK